MKSLLAPPRSARLPASAREDRITILLALWLIIGLFLDGYAHEELLDGGESFITPWHAVFYSGFAATAAWIWSLAARRREPGDALMTSLPPGYEHAWTGIVLFGIGGIGDALWHTAFGVEAGIDALLSPTHLVLFTGLLLILLSPRRAGRHDAPGSAPTGRAAAWSIVLATALVGFFANYVWGLGISELAGVPYDPASQAGETEVIAGVGSVLVTTAILFGAAATLLRRGRLPWWWFTAMFTLIAALVSLAFDEGGEGIAAAALAGMALDALTGSPWAARIRPEFALGASSLAMWAGFFALVGLGAGVAWPPEIWGGTIALAALAAAWIGGTVMRQGEARPPTARV